jgi:hypothetical protein
MTEQHRIAGARKYAESLLRELSELESLRGAKDPIHSHSTAAGALALCDDVRLLLLDLRDDYRRRQVREAETKKASKR